MQNSVIEPGSSFTVIGGAGLIGGALVTALRSGGHQVRIPRREEDVVDRRRLGHVIYAAGVTADFRSRPLDTVRAHSCQLLGLLEAGDFTSFLYLSSTRVYAGAARGEEDEPLWAGDLYNRSKLVGEAACLACERPEVRVVRLSNVYGGEVGSNFLDQVIRDSIRDRAVNLRASADSCRDYVALADVVGIVPRLAAAGTSRLYNVGSGQNVSNRELLEELRRLTDCVVAYLDHEPPLSYPPISIARVREEFGFAPQSLLTALPALVEARS